MSLSESEIPDDLRLKIDGFVNPDRPYHRNVLWEGLYAHLPRDPEALVRVYTGEVAPGVATDWHIHNGPSFFLLIQGRIRLEYLDGEAEYRAGDVFVEPIGKIHRAVNVDDDVPMVAFAWVATPPDREHVVNVRPPQ